jgi:hypothetical protein
LQTKSHVPDPHVAIVAFCGTGQGMHEPPHEFTLPLSKQFPLQLWVPPGQLPLQAIPLGMQLPKHSCCPFGHVPPQDVPSHVADPPVGAVHGVQDPLQLATSVLLTHMSLQTWNPVLHWRPHEVPSQEAAEALAVTGQALHDVPQLLTLLSSTHAGPHMCVPASQVMPASSVPMSLVKGSPSTSVNGTA